MNNLGRYYITVLGILLTLFGSGVALASDITNALYSGYIRQSNNTTTTLTNASVNFTLSTPSLISQGFANSSVSNVAIQNSGGVDLAFMPGINSTSPWIMEVPSIGPSQTINSILYTDNATGGKLRYFPDSTGMIINYSASMNPSANFSIETKGYVDTTKVSYFPSISSNTSGYGTNTIVPVTMPSGLVANDLILVFITGFDQTASAPPTFTAPGGFTQLYQWNYGILETGCAWYRVSTSSENATNTWSIDRNSYYAFQVMRIGKDSYALGNVPIAGVAALGVASQPNPPNLTSGFGVVDTMWIAVAHDRDTQASAPTNYSSLATNGQNNAYVATAERNLTATSENPGTFGTVTAWWAADTIAIKGQTNSIVSKNNAFDLTMGTISGNITARILGTSANITATGVSAGEHDILTELQPNIIIQTANATFESGIGGWGTSRATAAWDNIIYGEGTHSANITANDPGGVGASYFYIDIPWDNAYRGKTMTFGMLARAKSTNILNSHIYANDGTFYNGDDLAKNDTWYWVYKTFTVGMAATSLQVGVNPKYGSTPNTTDVVYVDIVVLLITSSLPNESNFRMFIDSAFQAGTYVEGISVPDNANNWVIGSSATPYLGLPIFKEYVNGALKCDIENWQYATTFTDSSSNNNTGYPSFKTTASNANLTATMVSFGPRSQAQANVSTNGTGDIFTSDPTAPSQLYIELDTSRIPGGDVIDALLAASDPSGASRALWWFPFIFIGTIIIGFMIYGATTGGGKAFGSLITMCIVCDLSMFTFGIMGVIPLWPAILFWIPAGALTLSQKHWGWG